MSPEVLGLVSLGALFIGIFAGFPISFTLIFLGSSSATSDSGRWCST